MVKTHKTKPQNTDKWIPVFGDYTFYSSSWWRERRTNFEKKVSQFRGAQILETPPNRTTESWEILDFDENIYLTSHTSIVISVERPHSWATLNLFCVYMRTELISRHNYEDLNWVFKGQLFGILVWWRLIEWNIIHIIVWISYRLRSHPVMDVHKCI